MCGQSLAEFYPSQLQFKLTLLAPVFGPAGRFLLRKQSSKLPSILRV